MSTDHRDKLANIRTFPQLVAYLRDEMNWPIEDGGAFEDLTFDYLPEELGIDPKTAAKIQEIKRLRPLSPKQPWGIFFVKFEPKRLPVVALRRILGQVALKKRASANSAERAAWAADDLLFVSNYGEGDERQISFAHFARAQDGHDLPTLKVLGWDNRDTALHLDAVARELTAYLAWPDDEANAEAWRTRWRAAFTLGHREVVTTSKELSIRLAELARAIRDRIKTALAIETDKGPLTRLMKAFQTALVHDLDADGFADMYAQTIAYGLLSARIADPSKKTADDFAAHMRTNPFLRELMETFLKVGGRKGKAGGQGKNDGIDFDELGVSEVVELLDAANMEAVVHDFGDRNPQEDPVIHFYELFLKEYDAKKRMSRGVFYTPRPVVSYIVRSVDQLLRAEFGLADGLADTTTWGEMAKRHKGPKIPEGVSPDQDFVQILDPATGTGTFLVEIIDLIHKTLVAKWKTQGHGGEMIDSLWNEYVPKHLLARLHGYELLMAPYAIAHLKIGLKLYETGYRFDSNQRARVYLTNALEPASDNQLAIEFLSPLAHEVAAVNEIKRGRRFTIVIGNPPYSSDSQNRGAFAAALVTRYKQGLNERKINLDDDYIKFLALAEKMLLSCDAGVFGMITNNTYLDGLTLRTMRRELLNTCRRLWIVDLHGSSAKKERAHDGGPDENVFDIEQGTCITIAVRKDSDGSTTEYCDLRGSRGHKYDLLQIGDPQPRLAVKPEAPNFFLAPKELSLSSEWMTWPSIAEAMLNKSGFMSQRDEFVLDEDEAILERRIRSYFESPLRGEALGAAFGIHDYRNFSVDGYREEHGFERHKIVRCLFRPFDYRFIYYEPTIVQQASAEIMAHLLKPNVGLVFMRQVVQEAGGYSHFFVTRDAVDHRCMRSNRGYANVAPLYLYGRGGALFASDERQANFSPELRRSLIEQQSTELDKSSANEQKDVSDALAYIYGVFHSPSYRARYLDYLKIDFPRLPLTGNRELFRALARLGSDLIALHLLESTKLDRPITEYDGVRGPEVEKVSWSRNTVWLDKPQTTGFKGVREEVWNFHIGGYRVCEKWLKDRKGRRLSKDDIAHYQKIVVALSETIRLMKEIDEVIEQHGGWPDAFQTSAAQTGEAKATLAKVLPFRPRTVEPKPAERYVTCVPLVSLKAAAGAFSDPQNLHQRGWDDDFEWVAVESHHRLRKGMFVAQVVGKSMEPAIPDGASCLFRAPVEGTRQGKTVLVQLRDATDPETGQRYTVKRYESEKIAKGDSWRHERITLKPVNPVFEPIVLTAMDEGELQVVAELVEVLRSES